MLLVPCTNTMPPTLGRRATASIRAAIACRALALSIGYGFLSSTSTFAIRPISGKAARSSSPLSGLRPLIHTA